MGNPSFSGSFAILLSPCLTASSSSSFFFKPTSLSMSPSHKPLPIPKATAVDLLSLLGPFSQSFTINPVVAQELSSCFKFLVPFVPGKGEWAFEGYSIRRRLSSFGGRPSRFSSWLDSPSIQVVSRCDFASSRSYCASYRFHAKEYPAYDKEVFPYNMGYCHIGYNVTYDNSVNLRNILWLAPLPSSLTKGWLAPGILVVLDANPGGIIYRDIIPDYVKFARTIYKDHFGDVAADVNCLNFGDSVPDYQIFIC